MSRHAETAAQLTVGDNAVMRETVDRAAVVRLVGLSIWARPFAVGRRHTVELGRGIAPELSPVKSSRLHRPALRWRRTSLGAAGLKLSRRRRAAAVFID